MGIRKFLFKKRENKFIGGDPFKNGEWIKKFRTLLFNSLSYVIVNL